MSNTPDTGRITLTLKADTIKALRLLALLKGESQNDVAEALFIAGGLHKAVDNEWNAGQTKPTATAPVEVMPVSTPTPQAAPMPPKPVSPRDGWMPEIPKVADDDEPSPYMKDGKVPW